MTDEWEGLFGIWHERAHGDKRDVMGILTALAELERRIVKLEAYIKAKRAQEADRAKNPRLSVLDRKD